jgi:glutathione peroxidase-family protein
MTDVYQFTAQTIDGSERPLADYRGSALLIVNRPLLTFNVPV